jgi:hypothetical protein
MPTTETLATSRVGHQRGVDELAGGGGVLDGLLRAVHLVGGQAEGHVGMGALVGGVVLFRDVLDDHVHVHPGIGQRAEDRGGDAGPVLDLQKGHLRLVAGIGDAGDYFRFHDFILVADQGSRVLVDLLEGGNDAQPHLVAHRQFHGPGLQDLGAEGGEFEHLLEGDLVQLAGLGADAGVGGVDAVNVGVDVAAFGAEGGGEGDGGGVRSAPAQGGDPAFGADALEARDDHDLEAFGELGVDVVAGNADKAGLAVGRGGVDRHLPALPGPRGHAHFLQAQRHQAGGHVLTRRHHGVVFAGVVEFRGGFDPAHKLVGLAGHGRDDDDDVIAALDLGLDLFGGVLDPGEVRHGGSAEFHHQKRHPRLPLGRSKRPLLMRGFGRGRKGQSRR